MCGLNDEVRNYLSAFSDLTDTPPADYIGTYMEHRTVDMDDEWTLKHKLQHLGFNNITAEFLADILKDQTDDIDDPTMWAYCYIQRVCRTIDDQINFENN